MMKRQGDLLLFPQGNVFLPEKLPQSGPGACIVPDTYGSPASLRISSEVTTCKFAAAQATKFS